MVYFVPRVLVSKINRCSIISKVRSPEFALIRMLSSVVREGVYYENGGRIRVSSLKKYDAN